MSRRFVRSALYGLLGGWFGLSLVGQKLFRGDAPSAWDRLYLLLPDWRFFAPDPGVHDYHILYRDRLRDGTATAWREVTSIAERRPHHAFWHPTLRKEKCAFDIVKELLRYVQDNPAGSEGVQLSVPYLTLLTHINAQPHDEAAVGIQFLLSLSGGHDDEPPFALFMSEVHPLEEGD
ncbi:hypothetical protein [Amycolatopsis minnesotensis]|uniref:Uncharacterized protein n=1 Tax=Amycolatopsis minnesotensis TaxID=337894 RepID=A0ABP5D302_9PSEU